MEPEINEMIGFYRHFKGNFYHVEGVAKHSETLEPMVVYRALYGEGALWVRPLEMFLEQVEKPEYQGPRFVRVDRSELPSSALTFLDE